MSAIIEFYLCVKSEDIFKLNDIGSFIRGLTYSNEEVTEDENSFVLIRANNLNYGSNVNLQDLLYVTKRPAKEQILQEGDIIICMANGSSALVGKNSYYSSGIKEATIGAFCGIFRTSNPLAKWYMQSSLYKRQIFLSLQGGNGAIANLNGKDILHMTFPKMSNEKEKEIVSILDSLEQDIAINISLQDLYIKQKQFFLHKLFI